VAVAHLRAHLDGTRLHALVARLRRLERSISARQRDRRAVREWVRAGRPVPPPHAAKQRLVRAKASSLGLRVFVETGTFRGDMVEAMRRQCRTIVSIELDDARFEAACARFAGRDGVTILHGDSALLLPDVIAGLEEPALFWLDGHYSGPGTSRGESDTPILTELAHVLGSDEPGHAILVDDARLFDGTRDYPGLADLERHVRELRPDVSFVVRDDVIEIGGRR